MSITQKNIIDDIKNLVSKFNVTDENRLNNDWLPLKIDEVRAQLITDSWNKNESLDQNWLTDLGLVTFHKVNLVDDPNINYCGCPISKAYIPQVISLNSKSPNQDLGIQMIMSTCGKNSYANKPLSFWNMIPAEHTYNMFPLYYRINTALYVNRSVTKLKIVALLTRPEDGYYIKSEPVTSGNIVSGTNYIVKFGSIAYNSTNYAEDATFTGAAATTYTGSGTVYLADQKAVYRDTYPYPISADMARQITLEICTKEFGIEKSQITDVRNDSKDDIQKS